MQILMLIWIVPVAALAFAGNAWGQTQKGSLTTVTSVDLGRYAGQWYEVSKIPNRFQRACEGNTTAQYTVRDDGRIDVLNQCKKGDGTMASARGIAKVSDPVSNAKLKVSFVHFLWRWWFWGDYWIIGLGEEYEYAVVGTPSRKYGWVLSRDPEIDPQKLERIREELKKQGYNPDDFEATRH